MNSADTLKRLFRQGHVDSGVVRRIRRETRHKLFASGLIELVPRNYHRDASQFELEYSLTEAGADLISRSLDDVSGKRTDAAWKAVEDA